MADNKLDFLLVEDNPGDARLIEEMLREAEGLLQRVDLGTASAAGGSRVYHEERLSDGLERLSETEVDVVLLDLGLPESAGLDTLATVVEATAFVPIVVLTGLRDEQVGIEAIQRGAQDYLVKDDVTSDMLARSIHHAIERNRQEREQARRHDQLEALNMLTRDLMNAETATEVSEYVIEAAEKLLDLPVTAIALYDDQEGTLKPAGMTDATTEVVQTASLFEVGDGPGWQAFTKGETRRVTIPHDEEDRPVHLPGTELAVVPLAKHGVFITGSTSAGGFTVADFDFVETIAGNVRATLDRVERKQQLHEREQALEEQNETLERLNRVNDIVRNIARALVQVSTRQELEAVVCEQLADVGLYEMAWIGDYDAVTERITSRESAGNEKGYLDHITIRTDESPEDRDPAGRAVKAREPQVVDDVLEDASFGPWRREALERGYHALIALPMVYEDTMYGVLIVYSGQPGIFNTLERAVLTELADTIAYATNALESKKALVSTEVTRLTFTVTDTNLEIVMMARNLDCEVVVENVISRPDGGVRGFFSTRGARPTNVLDFAPRLPVRDMTLVSEYEDDGEMVGLFQADLTDESLAVSMLEHGGRPHTLRVEDGAATVILDLAADAAVREFVEMFQMKYPESELVSQRTHEQPHRSPTELRASLTETLTDRQLEALQTAYFAGYFEEPRPSSGQDIANLMDISQPTFNSHLRAAQRKLSHKLFRENSLEDGNGGGSARTENP